MGRLVWIILVVAVLLIGFIIVVALDSQDEEIIKGQSGREIKTELNGVSLSPKSFGAGDFSSFFVKANEAGEAITGGDELGQISDSSSASIVARFSSQYDYEPVILIGLKNTNNLNADKEKLRNLLEKQNIKYLGLGVEANRYENYDAYASAYNELFEMVKKISPDTQIFPIFQYEQMRGLRGGLFGAENDNGNAEWALLSMKADMIGFTTYPGLIYKNPDDIPDDYYSVIKQRINKPIVFTEIGWFREGPVGWESSDDEQKLFVEKYFALTNDLDVRLNIWSFLYDPDTDSLFRTMGLLEDSEETSPAFEAWKNGNYRKSLRNVRLLK
ncbi:MAG: hypothetical protein AABY02_02960 [Nanoarchaeota archaeon]